MIAESVAFLVAQGKRVIYDAEHFFDGWRDDRDYALRCLRAAAAGGAERVVLCDTNGSSLPGQIAEATAGVCAGAARRPGRHPLPRRLRVGVANSLAAVEAGATQVQGTMNGVGERTGNANLVTIIANLQLKMGHEVLAPRAAGAPDGDRALRRRAAQPRAGPEPALRRPQRVRAQGRHARRRRPRRRRDLRAHRSDRGGQPPRAARLRARGPRHGAEKARTPASTSTADGRARPRARQGARARAATSSRPPTARSSCSCARRPATTSRCSGWSPGG